MQKNDELQENDYEQGIDKKTNEDHSGEDMDDKVVVEDDPLILFSRLSSNVTDIRYKINLVLKVEFKCR